MKWIKAGAANKEVRKLYKEVEKEVENQKIKQGLDADLRLWDIQREEWGLRKGNTGWTVTLGTRGNCFPGKPHKSLTKALQNAINRVKREEGVY